MTMSSSRQGNAEAIGSALRYLSQIVGGKGRYRGELGQRAQPIALAYLYSVGHGTRTMMQ